jgi:hypothetical protein
VGQTQSPVTVHTNQAEKHDTDGLAEQTVTPQLEAPTGFLASSFSIGEQLVKIAGLLAVFGYMELRAHLKYLGISSTSALGLERYLGEFYAMFTDILLRAQVLSSLALPVIVVLSVGVVIVRAADRKGKARQAAKSLFDWLRGCSTSPWLPGALLLLLICFQLWFLNQLSQSFFNSVVVGPLKSPVAPREKGGTLFDVLLYVVALAALIPWILAPAREHSPARQGARAARRFWTAYALVLAILGLVYLPNLYGAFVREAEYPRISVKSDTPAKMCGLLVLQTADDMRIWTVSNEIGRIVVMKASDAGLVITGVDGNLFDLTKDAANGKLVKYCPD